MWLNHWPQSDGLKQHILTILVFMGQKSELGLAGSPAPEICQVINWGCHLIRGSDGERSLSKLPQAVGKIHILTVAGLRSPFSC